MRRKKRFTEELDGLKAVKTSELILHQVLSHGKEGADNGIMKMKDGRQYAFRISIDLPEQKAPK